MSKGKWALNLEIFQTFAYKNLKNVHTDVRRLEEVGLIGRTKAEQVEVPWDIVEAQLRLAA